MWCSLRGYDLHTYTHHLPVAVISADSTLAVKGESIPPILFIPSAIKHNSTAIPSGVLYMERSNRSETTVDESATTENENGANVNVCTFRHAVGRRYTTMYHYIISKQLGRH